LEILNAGDFSRTGSGSPCVTRYVETPIGWMMFCRAYSTMGPLRLSQSRSPDSRTVDRRPHGSIDRRDIEAQFAGILRLELSGFQLDHKIAVQTNVVEEQVHVERGVVDDRRYLAANKGEAAAELKQ
jgi:hypothetical protein